ncbi:DUF4222 domain-containing protein [Edwardsiella tarda]|nr:DUF4222 domain-containing protein [Edwardsiella tarda]
MAKFPRVGHHYQDGLGNVVRVISTCADGQKVAYRRLGYDWTVSAALIVFNARFRRLAG